MYYYQVYIYITLYYSYNNFAFVFLHIFILLFLFSFPKTIPLNPIPEHAEDILETNDRVMKVMQDFRRLFPETSKPQSTPTTQAMPTTQAPPTTSNSSNQSDNADSLLKFSPTSDSSL